jgi:iron complex outermembrane receptor protein
MRFFHLFCTFSMFVSCVWYVPAVLAAENATTPDSNQVFEMDEYVVTGTSTKNQIKNIPRNVSVITAEDIEKSTAQNLPELLGREAGIQIFDQTGVPGRAKIDIRGQGASAPSNILVLVDGHRINSVDMSGANFSTISLSQIERIEILRGPGSVLYGNNAIGGVINIITKSGRVTPFAGQIGAEYSSYATTKVQAGIRGSKDILSMSVDGSWSDSDGYSENGEMNQKDMQVNIGLDPTEVVSINVSLAAHEEEYGMPGGVAYDDIDDRDARRDASSPDDGGSIEEQRLAMDVSLNLNQAGILKGSLGFRHKENPYTFEDYDPTDAYGYEGMDGFLKEETLDYSLTWSKNFSLLDRTHKIQAGVEGFSSDYRGSYDYRYNWGTYDDETAGDVDEKAAFISTNWTLLDGLILNLGARYTDHDIDKKTGDDKNWSKSVYEAGIVYSINDMASVYGSVSTGFRTPTIDEMNFATDDIKPQTTTNYEMGTRLKPLDNLAVEISAFRQETKDEIYYDAVNYLNDNYDDKTIRNGVEAGVKYYPVHFLALWLNYTWMQAKFEDTDKDVPLVPEHELSAGADWNILHNLLLSLSGRYTSTQYDGADVDNDTYDKLDDYIVVDTKLTWNCTETMKLYFGVNNVFDELYASTAYYGSYYVMPERNFFGGIEWKF